MSSAFTPRVIDVRSPGEFAGGHLPGSINLPLDRLEAVIASVAPDPDTPLVLCCASGARSAAGAALLARLGYRQVRNGGGVATLALGSGLTLQRG